MRDRVIIRPDPRGFGVIDPSAGRPAAIGPIPQAGLSKADADHLAQWLAAPGRDGERAPVQSLSWP